MAKSADAFRTISEVAEWLETPAHVLRFWESKFSQVKPVKRAGGRRYYRPGDMELLGGIKRLLHDEGMTIKGVQKLLRDRGVAHVSALSPRAIGGEDDAIAEAMETDATETANDGAETALIADAPFAENAEPSAAEPATVLPFRSAQPETAPAPDDAPAEPGPTPEPRTEPRVEQRDQVPEPEAEDHQDTLAVSGEATLPPSADDTADETDSAPAQNADLDTAESPPPAESDAGIVSETDDAPVQSDNPVSEQPPEADAPAENTDLPAKSEPQAPRPLSVDVPADPDDDDDDFPKTFGLLAKAASRTTPIDADAAKEIVPLLQRLSDWARANRQG